MCFSDGKQPTASWKLKKAYKKSEASDCLRKWETRPILSQVNASENSDSRKLILRVVSSLLLASKREACSIQINEPNSYLREETREECREDTSENKADEPWPVFKETVKGKKANEKIQ